MDATPPANNRITNTFANMNTPVRTRRVVTTLTTSRRNHDGRRPDMDGTPLIKTPELLDDRSQYRFAPPVAPGEGVRRNLFD